MTRLTTRAAAPNLGTLLHDLTEITGELVCGLPKWMMSCLPSPRTCGCGSGSAANACDRCAPPVGSCAPDDTCWPCWMPTELSPVADVVGAGSSARVTICVANRSLRKQRFFLAATGPDASLAHGAPSSVTVDAMSTGTIQAIVRAPSSRDGDCLELTLWIRGCHDYVVPVRLAVEGDRCNVTHVRHVVEQTDTCHTWRDHFYVSRPCRPDQQRTPSDLQVSAQPG